jgi:hypothetical protein
MAHFNKEKFKTIILVILILASLIQVEILWVHQNHKPPFRFLVNVFGKNDINNNADIEQKAREEILIPNRIVISNGNNAHWLLKEDDEKFYTLWDEALDYLKRALKEGGGQTLGFDVLERLIVSRSFVFEFKEGIKSSLIKWFFDTTGSSYIEYFENIQKVILYPEEDINKNNTLYILTDKNLYKYTYPFSKAGMSKKDYGEIIRGLESNKNLIRYNIVKEIDPNKQWPFKIPPGVLCVIKNPQYKKYYPITYSFGGKDTDVEEKAKIILGDEKESFDRYIIDKYNTLVFKNLNNTYRLYNDGLLEYKYLLGVSEQDKGDIGNAFKKVYTFINRIKSYLLGYDANIYLVDVKENNPNYYEFVFDYVVDGYPVYIDYKPKYRDNSSDNIKNAITIKVDNKRIIEIEWLLMGISKNKDEKEYNIYFQYVLDEIPKKYGKEKIIDFAVENIIIGYLINSSYGTAIDPVWIIEKPDKSYYYVPIMQKKGE